MAPSAPDRSPCARGVRRALAAAAGVVAALAAALPATARTSPPPPAAPTPAVYGEDLPDPFVLPVPGLFAGMVYVAFGTNSAGVNVPVATSVDLTRWEPKGDALPVLPFWARPGRTWAPAALVRGGTYHLFYTVTDRGSGRQCISRAESRRPEGPYVDGGTWALVCQLDRGGSIDPSVFVDRDGAPWLLWKSEGIPGREPARLWSQRLTADARGLLGRPAELLAAGGGWEDGVIEAPAMVRDGGSYLLLYSGNRWDTRSYAVGAARCPSPAGPCTRVGPGPILAAGPFGAGPGSVEVFTELGGAPAVVYHAWDGPRVGYPAGRRTMRIGRLTVGPSGPTITPRR
jgi:hypothetical protein